MAIVEKPGTYLSSISTASGHGRESIQAQNIIYRVLSSPLALHKHLKVLFSISQAE